MRRQSRLWKHALLALHVCWLGLTATITVLFVHLTTKSLLNLDFTNALSGFGGVVATAPGIAHYLRLVIRSLWLLRTRSDQPLGLFW